MKKILEDMENLPPATPKPCDECPWRRNSTGGWLGPYTIEKWLKIAHGESPIACHKTIKNTNEDGDGDWQDGVMRQCRGAAIYRANVNKLPIFEKVVVGPVDKEAVFASPQEFAEHHDTPFYRGVRKIVEEQ